MSMHYLQENNNSEMFITTDSLLFTFHLAAVVGIYDDNKGTNLK